MTTYGNDTSHDDGDDTLHHQVRSQHRHGGDTDTRLGSSITMRREKVMRNTVRTQRK